MRLGRVLGAVSLLLVVGLTGCTSDNGDEPADAPPDAASTTPSAAEPAPSPAPGTTAVVVWGSNTSGFVLVLCETSDGSLQASGDDIAGGKLLTIDAEGGTGTVSIAEDASLKETFVGELQSFDVDGSGKFQGAGTYTAGDATGDFTVTGTCTQP